MGTAPSHRDQQDSIGQRQVLGLYHPPSYDPDICQIPNRIYPDPYPVGMTQPAGRGLGALHGPMGPHVVPWGPMEPHGAPWGPMGPYGALWGPLWAHGAAAGMLKAVYTCWCECVCAWPPLASDHPQPPTRLQTSLCTSRRDPVYQAKNYVSVAQNA